MRVLFFFFFLLVPWLRDTYTRSQAPLPGATSAYRLDVRGQAVVSSPFDFGNCTRLQIHPRFPDVIAVVDLIRNSEEPGVLELLTEVDHLVLRQDGC